MNRAVRQHTALPAAQRGAVVLLLLLILTISTASYFLVKRLNGNALNIERDAITAVALAQAKSALIGWSVAHQNGTNPRPGELPCPDTDAPGTVGYGSEQGSCAPGAIGRLPWKTLGIPELKDGYGETLWYAIDGNFRKRNSNSKPINSDTRPTLQVYASDGTTLLTPAGSECVAIIFSPGAPIGNQVRGTAAEQTTTANYLDNAGPPVISVTRNNAMTNGPFVQGSIKDSRGNVSLNDSLMLVTSADLMAVVEKLVATELKAGLHNYWGAHGFYPFPAKYDDSNSPPPATNCLDVGSAAYFSNCLSNPNVCRGRVPADSLPVLPGWFVYNLWGQIIYYSVGTNFLDAITYAMPPNCSPTLTVDGVSGIKGLFIMPGVPLGSIIRNSGSQSINLVDYVEDTMNQRGWTGTSPTADQYCTPGKTTCLPSPAIKTNDHLQILP